MQQQNCASVQEVNACSFTNWYPVFSKHALPGQIIPLSTEFVNYLQQDTGLFLPKSVTKKRKVICEQGDDYQEWSSDEENADDVYAPEFPTIQKAIQDAITKYEGAVFPKLNWSAPRDATYMCAENCVKCCNVEDVFLILKSSDFIVHDLERAYQDHEQNDTTTIQQVPRVLVLKKWYSMQASMEFRCFVYQNHMVALCQRDTGNFYPFLLEQAAECKQKCIAFVTQHVLNKFPVPNFVIDLYISKAGKVWIVDFNVFGSPTESLLFEWDELCSNPIPNSNDAIPFRLIESQQHVQPSLSMYSRLPHDFYDVQNTSKIQQMAKEQQQEDTD